MTWMTRLTLPALAVAAVFGAAAPVSAVVLAPTTTTFYFTGQCSDCYKGLGSDTAELTLQNYTLGSPISSANFVSFHFDGSDLYPAFTITTPNYIAGSVRAPLPSAESFYVQDASNYFSSGSTGVWDLGTGLLPADVGTNGIFALAPASTTVPEPLSLTLMLTGLAGTALLTRRRT